MPKAARYRLTDEELRDTVEAYKRLKSQYKVADEFGITREAVGYRLKLAQEKGVGWRAPVDVPTHMHLAKTTVQYNGKTGEVEREWARLVPGAQEMQEFVDRLCEQVDGTAKLPRLRIGRTTNKGMLGTIDIFDAHIGMYASAKETLDEDYDCEIAAESLRKTAQRLMQRMDRPERMVVAFGGDMLHSDTRNNRTELSGNVLDVDSRYHRVVDYLVTVVQDIVAMAAGYAPYVDVVVVEGNHSWHSEVWLAQVLKAYFSKCPNVNVLVQHSARKHIVWGSNLLVYAHGDGVAMNKWGQIIPNEYRELWGKTKHCHVKTGHVHHRKGKKSSTFTEDKNGWEEHAGVMVESLPASCPADAWHSAKGFKGQVKGMAAFEYHQEHGLLTRLLQPVIR